mmetsp:Transcript_31716/g.104939  ORF Transcript_31716/g.104939 Transcript_31716/m.104939 type:complete len:251 (-) Transcript_31716:61-813(-)
MKPSPRSSGAFEAAAAVALYFFRIEPPSAPPPTVTSSPATPSSARLPRRQVFEVLSAAVDGFGGGAAPRSRASSASRPLTLASVVACASVAPKALSLAAIFAYSSRWLCFSAISRRFRSRSVGFLSASDVVAAAGRRARTSLAPDVAITSLAPGVARTSLAPDVFADARTSPPPAMAPDVHMRVRMGLLFSSVAYHSPPGMADASRAPPRHCLSRRGARWTRFAGDCSATALSRMMRPRSKQNMVLELMQ